MRENNNHVQVIKTSNMTENKLKIAEDWQLTIKRGKEIDKLAEELDALIDDLSLKFEQLHDKIKEAYVGAPLVDAGLNSSPLGPGRVMHSMKSHLRRNGLVIDRSYLGDTTKLRSFKEYLKDGVKWLTKFSTLN
jgi:hypothetical protein